MVRGHVMPGFPLDGGGCRIELGVCGVSLLGALGGLLVLSLPRLRRVSWVVRCCAFLLLLLGAFQAGDLLALVPESGTGWLLRSALLAGGALALVALDPLAALGRVTLPAAQPLRLPLALLLVSTALVHWLAYRMTNQPGPDLEVRWLSGADLVEVRGVVACTDRGTRIPVFTYRSPSCPDDAG